MTTLKSIFLAMLVSFVLSYSVAVHGEKRQQALQLQALEKKMSVKCYVEYLGGGDDIRFAIGAFKTPNHVQGLLQGRKVIKNNGKSNKSIFKVKECVKSAEQFSSSRAKLLDKSVAR